MFGKLSRPFERDVREKQELIVLANVISIPSKN